MRTEELFYTINFSRTEQSEKTMDVAALRKRIEEEIQK